MEKGRLSYSATSQKGVAMTTTATTRAKVAPTSPVVRYIGPAVVIPVF